MDIKEVIREHHEKMGRKGGKSTLERYGKDHFRRIGEKGRNKRWGKKKDEDTNR